jgi:hypothetical protein
VKVPGSLNVKENDGFDELRLPESHLPVSLVQVCVVVSWSVTVTFVPTLTARSLGLKLKLLIVRAEPDPEGGAVVGVVVAGAAVVVVVGCAFGAVVAVVDAVGEAPVDLAVVRVVGGAVVGAADAFSVLDVVPAARVVDVWLVLAAVVSVVEVDSDVVVDELAVDVPAALLLPLLPHAANPVTATMTSTRRDLRMPGIRVQPRRGFPMRRAWEPTYGDVVVVVQFVAPATTAATPGSALLSLEARLAGRVTAGAGSSGDPASATAWRLAQTPFTPLRARLAGFEGDVGDVLWHERNVITPSMVLMTSAIRVPRPRAFTL